MAGMCARQINLGADATDADFQIRDTSSTGGDLVIEHLPSGGTFEYDSSKNVWQPTDPIDLNAENLDDGATTVYDASTDTVGDGTNTSADHTSVSTDELIIGGTLYEEDDNNPINVSTSSTTYTVSGTYDVIYVIQEMGTTGFNELQVNGDTGANYDFVDNSGSVTTGASQWSLRRAQSRDYLKIQADGGRAMFSAPIAFADGSSAVSGNNDNVTAPISQFTLKDGGGTTRSLKARVYGRSMDI